MICRAHLDGGGDLPEHVVGELVVERHHQDLLERLGRDLARVAAVDRVEQVLQAGACVTSRAASRLQSVWHGTSSSALFKTTLRVLLSSRRVLTDS